MPIIASIVKQEPDAPVQSLTKVSSLSKLAPSILIPSKQEKIPMKSPRKQETTVKSIVIQK